MTAALDLQGAIVAALRADAPLNALFGGAYVFDDVPPGRQPPYAVIGKIISADWSTGSDDGEEHTIEITAWTHKSGRKQAVLVADAIRTCLLEHLFVLPGHAVVNLRHLQTESMAERDDRHFLATVRLRAVTEPL